MQAEKRRAGNGRRIAKSPIVIPSDVAAVIKEYQETARPEQKPAKPLQPAAEDYTSKTSDDKDDDDRSPDKSRIAIRPTVDDNSLDCFKCPPNGSSSSSLGPKMKGTTPAIEAMGVD